MPLLSMSQDNQAMDYQQKSQIDSVKAARRYSRALQERKHCDEKKAKNIILIAAVLLCILMTTFSPRTSGPLKKTADRLHIPAHMTHLIVLR
jgi:hypothetical protein